MRQLLHKAYYHRYKVLLYLLGNKLGRNHSKLQKYYSTDYRLLLPRLLLGCNFDYKFFDIPLVWKTQ